MRLVAQLGNYGMHLIRDAFEADREAIAAMFTRAFANDPAVVWCQPDPVERAAQTVVSFGRAFDRDADGMRLTTTGCEAATLWQFCARSRSPKGQANLPDPQGAAETMTARRRRLMMEALEAHKPAGDYWYLHVAGCEPTNQGTGLGAMVVRGGLERIEGFPAYLETANEQNLGFYRSLGFEVTEEWSVPDDGPRFWSMSWRVA